jgi:hypothetical protein
MTSQGYRGSSLTRLAQYSSRSNSSLGSTSTGFDGLDILRRATSQDVDGIFPENVAEGANDNEPLLELRAFGNVC